LAHALTTLAARRQSVSGVTYEFSVDLLAASRAYLDFFTKVEQTLTTQLLTNRHRVAQAIDRYAKVPHRSMQQVQV
jgi:C4-dicarboxylate-specific signal transduction histidine kinase